MSDSLVVAEKIFFRRASSFALEERAKLLAELFLSTKLIRSCGVINEQIKCR
jgi:hypothetical protein